MVAERGAPGRLRLAAFWSLLLALVLGGVEAGSALLLRVLHLPGGGDPELAAEVQAAGSAQRPIDNALHPFLGYVLDPEHHPEASRPGRPPEAIEWGFPRNHENLFHEPSPDRVIVGIFGGSVASILTNAGAKTIRKGLGEIPRFAGKKIVVVGMAQGGYKQPQQLMTLNYFLSLGAHLDVAINVDGFNDVALPPVDNRPKKVFPFYPRNWYWLLQGTSGELRRQAGELAYLQAARAEAATAFEGSIWRRSRTARLLHALEDRRLAGRIGRLQAQLAEREVSLPLSYEVRGPRRDYSSDAEFYHDLVAVWQRSSRVMHAVCRGFGIEYYHVLQPNQYVPGTKTLSPEEKEKFFREDSVFRRPAEIAYPLLVAAGTELRRDGIPFFDLSGVFADRPGTIYNDDCCHYNLAGNLILGDAIARAIAAETAAR